MKKWIAVCLWSIFIPLVCINGVRLWNIHKAEKYYSEHPAATLMKFPERDWIKKSPNGHILQNVSIDGPTFVVLGKRVHKQELIKGYEENVYDEKGRCWTVTYDAKDNPLAIEHYCVGWIRDTNAANKQGESVKYTTEPGSL